MTPEQILVEGPALRVAAEVTLVPVWLWQRWPDGRESVEPLRIVVATASGTRVLEVGATADYPGVDGQAGDALSEAERQALCAAVLDWSGTSGQLWATEWPTGRADSSPQQVERGRLVLGAAGLAFEAS